MSIGPLLTIIIDDATPDGMLACKPESGAHYRYHRAIVKLENKLTSRI